LYVQRRSANIWKEKVLEDLEIGVLEYTIVRKFLVDLKKQFDRRDNKTTKVAKLIKIEQRSRTIEEFV